MQESIWIFLTRLTLLNFCFGSWRCLFDDIGQWGLFWFRFERFAPWTKKSCCRPWLLFLTLFWVLLSTLACCVSFASRSKANKDRHQTNHTAGKGQQTFPAPNQGRQRTNPAPIKGRRQMIPIPKRERRQTNPAPEKVHRTNPAPTQGVSEQIMHPKQWHHRTNHAPIEGRRWTILMPRKERRQASPAPKKNRKMHLAPNQGRRRTNPTHKARTSPNEPCTHKGASPKNPIN